MAMALVVVEGARGWRERQDGKGRRMKKLGYTEKKRKRGGQIESVGKASCAKLDGPGEETVN